MQDVQTKSFHLHHMVWGILGLLAIGYVWLAQVGTGMPSQSQGGPALMAVLYCICGAPTLASA